MRIPVKFIKMSAAGLVALALAEGYRTDAYLDIVGVPTIGYGETSGVKLGQKTTPERALVQLLKSADDKHATGMKKCMGDIVLHQYEYDAYLNFTYNIGVAGFCRSNTLKLLKQSKYTEACHAMMGWVKPKRLRSRREREVQMCLGNLSGG